MDKCEHVENVDGKEKVCGKPATGGMRCDDHWDAGIRVRHAASGQVMEVGRKALENGEFPGWVPVIDVDLTAPVVAEAASEA